VRAGDEPADGAHGPEAHGPDGGRGGDGAAPAPVLRLVRGDATEAELAALVAAILASAAGADGDGAPAPRRATTAWTDRSRLIGGPTRPGPGAWRASAWPH